MTTSLLESDHTHEHSPIRGRRYHQRIPDRGVVSQKCHLREQNMICILLLFVVVVERDKCGLNQTYSQCCNVIVIIVGLYHANHYNRSFDFLFFVLCQLKILILIILVKSIDFWEGEGKRLIEIKREVERQEHPHPV